ncbi:MAG TPA: hypothetical protein VKA15_12060 [Isosphaeraceae bacterium]|nr:hypothetical protein [Isosphaeraceae bacterium]
MSVVVPEEDDRFDQGVLVAEDAERRGAEPEVTRVRRRQAEPAGGQDAEEMAMSEEISRLSRSPRLRALASPRAVSGISVRPVCWREMVHAVSPCRAR